MISTLLSLYLAGTLTTGTPNAAPNQKINWDHPASITTANSQPDSGDILTKKVETNIAPVIKAKSAIAVDLDNGSILYEKNSFIPRPIASLTKLMTVSIVLDENKLNDIVTISKKVSKTTGSKIWLMEGETITVENLLYATLINSANDAAAALAEFNSGSDDKFVEKMNQKSRDLELTGTNFLNPTGLDMDDTGQQDNQSTAYDLAVLAHHAYGYNFVKKAASKTSYEITSTDGKITHKLQTTNDLLKSYLKVLGLKTGTTDQAGECLIAITQSDTGHKILTVVLNSPNRYNETKVLVDWIFRTYQI